MLVFGLLVRGLDVLFVRVALFFGRRMVIHAVFATVEAGVYVVDDHRARVRIVNHGDVHVRNGAVVEEMSATPFAARETDAAVAEAVVNATVEADVRAPISGVPTVRSARPTPIAGRPEKSGPRRHNPRAGNPIIAGVTVRPIAGRPDVAVAGANRLLVNGKCRRPDVHRDSDSNLRRGRGRKCKNAKRD